MWTILTIDGHNHLGLWLDRISSNKISLITLFLCCRLFAVNAIYKMEGEFKQVAGRW